MKNVCKLLALCTMTHIALFSFAYSQSSTEDSLSYSRYENPEVIPYAHYSDACDLSFEDYDFSKEWKRFIGANMGSRCRVSWVPNVSCAHYEPTLEVQKDILVKPSHGTYFVELDSDCNSAVEMDFNTQQGGLYTILFDAMKRPWRANSDNGIKLYINDVLVEVYEGWSLGTAWNTKGATFVAGWPVAIKWASAGTSNSYGNFLDNIRLVPGDEEGQYKSVEYFVPELYEWDGEATNVRVEVVGGLISIGSVDSFDLWSIIVSWSETVLEKAFSWDNNQYFWVKDLKWADQGYYTTVQSTDLVNIWHSGTFIPAENLSLKVADRTITTIQGRENPRVTLWPRISDEYVSLAEPLTLIVRPSWTNVGNIGKYGISPILQLVIPAFQSPGEYRGKISFTIFDSDPLSEGENNDE